MVANFAALGILDLDRRAPRRPRRRRAVPRADALPVAAAWRSRRWFSSASCCDVQLVRADRYVVKPHLSLQADGVARYQYNPRVLDLVRALPRGSVFDRAGRVLATGDPELARQARTRRIQKLGVTPNGTCVEPVARCYPLGGAGFHLLGDAGTRENWSASNSSYVERDADDRLRGFDDHAAAVQSTDEQGRPVRHRPPRLRRAGAAAAPSPSAGRAPRRRRSSPATATCAPPSTRGCSCASRRSSAPPPSGRKAGAPRPWCSMPRPATCWRSAAIRSRWSIAPSGRSPRGAPRRCSIASRYGLYPPGSTFKLVTAAAALRQDPALQRARPSPAATCPTAASACAFPAGGRCATTCSITIRTARSPCTTGWCTRATPTSRSWR